MIFHQAPALYSTNGLPPVTSVGGSLVTLASPSRYARIVFGNGIFVVVGGGTINIVQTSTDGINWTSQSIPGLTWCDIAFSHGTFVICCRNGGYTMYRSTDGVTWTNTGKAGIYATASPTLFVAIGTALITSPDAITWTTRTIGGSGWNGLCYGGGTFVALAGTSTTTAYSLDGITWSLSTRPSGAGNLYNSYGNGMFISAGATNAISYDGINWSASAGLVGGRMIYGDQGWVQSQTTSVGGAVKTFGMSKDGLIWSTSSLLPNLIWIDVAYGNGVYVLLSVYGTTAVVTLNPAP